MLPNKRGLARNEQLQSVIQRVGVNVAVTPGDALVASVANVIDAVRAIDPDAGTRAVVERGIL
jgi:hypothetical protein